MIKQILISTFMVTISLIANCQDTVYFDKNLDSIDKHSASYFQIKRDDPSFPGRLIVETFYVNGSRKEIRYYTDRTEKIQTGVSQKWHANGQIKSKINYENGLLSDTLFTFWENGQLKRQDIYQNGKFIKGNCYNTSGKKIPHFDYEEMPKYPGGDNQLFMDIFSSITMPDIVKNKQLKTKVIARFAVDSDGYVKDIEVPEDTYPELKYVIVRALTSLKQWQPGSVDGEPVKVHYSVPFSFEAR
jgi:hypothetical protein